MKEGLRHPEKAQNQDKNKIYLKFEEGDRSA
jgi:hypothetical protein